MPINQAIAVTESLETVGLKWLGGIIRESALYLKPGLTGSLLRQQAGRHSDTEAALLMQKAKLDLLKRARFPS